MIRAEIHDIGSKNKNTILNLCDRTSGPGEYYANRNKPVRERQISYDFIYVESNEQISKIKMNSYMKKIN